MIRPPAATYERLARQEEERLGEMRRTAERLVSGRIALFVAALVALSFAAPLRGDGPPAAWLALAGALAAFVALVVAHARLRRRIRRTERRQALARLGSARLERDWAALEEGAHPSGPETPVDPRHPYAPDLHLFGTVSLFRLLGPVTTAPGRRTLAGWLASPAPPEELRARQRAVEALAPHVDLRHALAVAGPERPVPAAAVRTFLDWSGEPAWLLDRRGIRVLAWTLPLVTVGLMVAQATAGTGLLWLLPLAVQIWLQRRWGAEIGPEVERAAAAHDGVAAYAEQLEVVERLEAELGADLGAARVAGAGEALRSLAPRLDLATSRNNAFYRLIDAVLLVEPRAYAALERWKRRHGSSVEGWLEALGRVEALSALATLAHDQPAWARPELVDAPRLDASALGHPLLHPDACVRNDVTVGPPDTFLLVTGSNMSGKSTLLRAIGANVALALAGGPVCAERFALPPVRLFTSMRVEDSLEEGVSRFMAELLRLRQVVEGAREDVEGRALYLLDEMMQGTNSAERRIAARTVLRHLLEEGALGAVTSHDLALHDAPDLSPRARPVHFRERVEPRADADGRPRLTFDYLLRPGLAPTTNALALLRAVGLGERDGRGIGLASTSSSETDDRNDHEGD